jgi:hypothetical protein
MLNAHPDRTASVRVGLGWYYLVMLLMNLYWTVQAFHHDGEYANGLPRATPWAIYSSILGMVCFYHFTYPPDGFLIYMPEVFKVNFDRYFSNPVLYFALSIAGFWALIALREWWTKPKVSWVLLNLSLLFMGLSMTDYDFRQIVGKPDNVPIVAMLFIVAFCTWIYFRRAVDNDRRMAEGRPL